MKMHSFDIPESFAEMRDRNRDLQVENEITTDEGLLENEFENGEYHEEEVLWSHLAEKLTTEDVTSMMLPVIKHLIASEYREGSDGMKTITDFYRIFEKWAKNRLTDPEEILSACLSMRKILGKKCDPSALPWRIDSLRSFSLVEMAIHGRMGLRASDLLSKYTTIMEGLIQER